jgi:SAM-dependent methyltransferase
MQIKAEKGDSSFMAFRNVYADATRADSYAQLEFANTYHLAFRDLPVIIREHVTGTRALDFGCGAGRSTRFVRRLGFETTGVDIAPEMIAKARELDPAGDYRVVPRDDFSGLGAAAYDLVTSLFTFDNIPGFDTKLGIIRDFTALLKPSGKLISVVSSPEIYLHEWASFSTRDFLAENRIARSGDEVRIVTTDFPDSRPCVDILCPDETYRELYARAGLIVSAMHEPLASGDEPYKWGSETKIAPWVIYVLAKRS